MVLGYMVGSDYHVPVLLWSPPQIYLVYSTWNFKLGVFCSSTIYQARGQDAGAPVLLGAHRRIVRCGQARTGVKMTNTPSTVLMGRKAGFKGGRGGGVTHVAYYSMWSTLCR